MDPFEGRLQFLHLLRHLQASQASQLKTAQFAIKYKDLDEDLFSCILEELSTTSFNAKINILYLLETLCDAARRAGCTNYISMTQRDLNQIIDDVAPPGAQGLANVGQTRHFLKNMVEKQFLTPERCLEFDTVLAARESSGTVQKEDGANRVIAKEDIFRRIEEDRERHKRLRESLWVIPPNDNEYEFDQAWAETSDLCSDDFESMKEEMALHRQSLSTY